MQKSYNDECTLAVSLRSRCLAQSASTRSLGTGTCQVVTTDSPQVVTTDSPQELNTIAHDNDPFVALQMKLVALCAKQSERCGRSWCMHLALPISARSPSARLTHSPRPCRRRLSCVAPENVQNCASEEHSAGRKSVEKLNSEDLNCAQVLQGCSCCVVHKWLNNPPVLETARAFFSSYGVSFQNNSSSIHGWRTRARLAVQGSRSPKDGRVSIGLFERGTHEVLHLLECPLHHPQINKAVKLVYKSVVDHGIKPYVEVPLPKKDKAESWTGSHGLLRYLQITTCATEKSSQTHKEALVQLVCVVNCSPEDAQAVAPLQKVLASLYAQHGQSSSYPLFHSIWLNFQQSPGNAILGASSKHLHGERWIWHQYGQVMVALSPTGFVQVSLHVRQAIWQVHGPFC
jgi:hypothetical protein